MPFLSVVAAAYVIAAAVLVSLAQRRSVAQALRRPGVALGAAAGVAAVAATPADGTWHAAFGVDSQLWSPPHLLSVLGTAVLIVAGLVVTSRVDGGAGRIGLGAVLLGVTQVVLAEYDADVPQFAEVLYLPLLVVTGLGTGWLVHRTVSHRFAVCWAVAGFLALRVTVLVVLAAVGLPRPDLPVGLVGLVVVDVVPRRWGRLRWPLACVAVTAGQVLAAGVGISSVAPGPTLTSAVVVVAVLVVLVVVLVLGRAGVSLALVVGLVVGVPLFAASPARAHSPGSGPVVGAADVAVTGNGAGVLDVAITPIRGVSSVDIRNVRLVARRAGRTVVGVARPSVPSARSVPSTDTAFVGSIDVPTPGLWFVYADINADGRRVEMWRAVEYDTTGPIVERRGIYLTSGPQPRPMAEYVAGTLLYGVCVALVAWTVMITRRSRSAW
jgi:hypothetical protein